MRNTKITRGRLSLTRNKDQSIIIKTKDGELINIKILELGKNSRSNCVKILVDAPLTCGIDREEIFHKKHPEDLTLN